MVVHPPISGGYKALVKPLLRDTRLVTGDQQDRLALGVESIGDAPPQPGVPVTPRVPLTP